MAKQNATLPLFPILSPAPEPPELKGIARMAAQTVVVDEGHNVEFRALQVRSILNHTKSRRGFDFARSINPYRGCEFGCHYCYARYTHEYMELREPHAFEQQVYMKENAAWLLRQELRNLRAGEAIAIGTATDPYQPIERDAQITRSLLEVLATQQDLRIGVVTKSTLVVRDIELLQRIAEHNSITLNLTITTLDTRLARILEPRAPRPDLRLNALEQLRRAGLRAGVLCCPLLPGITDTYAAIDSVATGAKQAGASFFHANPLFLKPCSKTVFEEFIAKNFPELLASYRERFRDKAFVGPVYRKRMAQIVEEVKKKHGWSRNSDPRAKHPPTSLKNAQLEMLNG
jgi:DNA repair photolyase